jgi:hypothetical protein
LALWHFGTQHAVALWHFGTQHAVALWHFGTQHWAVADVFRGSTFCKVLVNNHFRRQVRGMWPDCFSAMPIPVSASSDGTREANQFSTEKSA